MSAAPLSVPGAPSVGGRIGAWLRRQWSGLLFVAGLIAFPYVFALLSGSPVDDGPPKFWQGLIAEVFIMAVYAMSYDLLMGYTGILSFGHAAFFGGGAYAMGLFLKHVAPGILAAYRVEILPGVEVTEPALLLVGTLLVMVVSALLGLLFSAVSTRVRGVYFAMVTLAIAQALYIMLKATDFVEYTGADEGLRGVPVPAWLNPTDHRLQFYYIALVFAVIMYLVVRRIVESPAGHVLVALRENENRVRMIGYNPAAYRTLAFVVAAIVAGLAGALFAILNTSATPSMGDALTTIDALIMTILGGIGTLIGPMLGAGVMQVLGHFLYQWFGARWPLVFGLIYVLLVLFLPYGIVGTWRMRKANVREGWKRLVGLVSGQ